MAEYTVTLSKTVRKQLDLLPERDFKTIIETLQSLAREPRPAGCLKLRGRHGFRVRCGNYRIIYEIHDSLLVVLILAIGHRKDIYR
jgi:mRNA interferase RelE/StbE